MSAIIWFSTGICAGAVLATLLIVWLDRRCGPKF